ncbi:MAG: carboxypeptidase-like regulatory domain-containing protein, partial [Myxococcota bacterium]
MIPLLTFACAPGGPTATDGEPVEAALRDGVLGGRVVDLDGAPIAGATVVTDPRGYEAATGADGSFTVDHLLAGTYVVVVAAEGFAPTDTDPVTVVAGEVSTVEVALAAAAPPEPTLQVEVTGPDGAPLAGATVEAAGASGQTDALGVVTLNPGAGAVDVVVSYSGTWTRTVRGVELPAAGGAQLALTLSARAPADAVVAGNGLCVLCHLEHDAATRHARAVVLAPDEPLVAFVEGWTVDLGDGASARMAAGPS